MACNGRSVVFVSMVRSVQGGSALLTALVWEPLLLDWASGVKERSVFPLRNVDPDRVLSHLTRHSPTSSGASAVTESFSEGSPGAT